MKSLRKNIFREILKTKSRFISILAIIGLSVGFFSGLKSACPSMIKTADQYFEDQNFMDISLISTVGFGDDDIKNIKNLDEVIDVMPSYRSDLLVSMNGVDTVARVYAVPKKTDTNSSPVNEPVVVEGRLPTKSGECAIESYYGGYMHFKIGDTIKFEETVDGKSTDNYVKYLEYKIVGFIDSPMYLTFSRGNTNIGDGKIAFYMMIPPDDFNYERYTNVYVTTQASNKGLSGFSDEYKSIIEDETDEFEQLSDLCINRFNNTTLADAKKQLSDAQKEYSKAKQEAETKIADGEKELYNAQKEFNEKIAEAEKTISDNERKLEEAKKQLEQGKQEYSGGIEQAYQQLVDAQNQYNEGKSQYEQAQLEYSSQISQAQQELDSALTEYNNKYIEFYTVTKPQTEAKLTVLKTAIELANGEIQKLKDKISQLENSEYITDEIKAQLDEAVSKLNEYQKKLSEYQQQYNEGKLQLEQGERLLLEGKKQLDEAQAEFNAKKEEGARKLSEAKSALETAESQLNTGRLKYETEMNNGMLQLQSAQSEIEEGKEQLEKGKKELETQREEGRQQLKAAREQLIQGKYDAQMQLSDAEKKLKDAQKQIDSLEDAKWYINGRNDDSGYSGLVEDANRVDSVATVFPAFFLIVAVLVCLTTMTRMVEERRTEIGTLKALGYSNAAISLKYFIYAASAAIVGCIVGSVIGLLTLPFIIVDTYGIMYILPSTKLSIEWYSVLFASIAGVVCTCAVAMITCFKELKINPATLMRPKSPKPGKRILLEYIKPLWNHMNFTSKVTARNLFRYKSRSLMTIIGIAGCTALIIAGFALKNSISLIAGRQFDDITKYDETYALSESGTADEKAYIMSQFHSDDRFETTLLTYFNSSFAYYDDKYNKISFTIIAGEDKESFEKMFELRERVGHKKLTLDDSGIIITERMSDVINAKVGDTIHLTINDEYYDVKVSGITENYAGNYGYMTPEYYRSITGDEIEYNLVLTSLADGIVESEDEIANEWMQNDDIVTVSLLSETISTVNDMIQSLDFIVFVMIFCAGLLAVIVLYNLTNINISERVREIATIKVLGFYNLETANYIYRENIMLTLGGAIFGMFLGSALSIFIIETIQMDMVMFPKEISVFCYIMGFILTFVFSMLVNLIMYFKMKKISMVESLKSIE